MRYQTSFSQMAIFVKVAETESLSKAAQKLNLSPSAVSKSLTQLERRLDTLLLKRTTRSVSLTQQGAEFLERAQKILNDLETAMNETAGTQKAIKGRLRLTTSIAFGYTQLAAILVKYQKQYPDVEVIVELDDNYRNLGEDDIDIALRITSKTDWGYAARRLGDVHWIYCASPAYIKNHPQLKHPSDIRQHACLVYPNMSDNGLWHFEKKGHVETIKVKGRLTANSSLMLMEAALDGHGIACLPDYAIKQALSQKTLVTVLDGYHSTKTHQLYAMYFPSRYNNAVIRSFIDFLVVNRQQ